MTIFAEYCLIWIKSSYINTCIIDIVHCYFFSSYNDISDFVKLCFDVFFNFSFSISTITMTSSLISSYDC